MRCLHCLFVILIINVLCNAFEVRQEGAKVTQCNINYLTDCYAITKRTKRGEPYRTTCTVTTRHAWGNNVTIRVVLNTEGFPIEVLKTKLCDIPKIAWFNDYVNTYSDVGPHCPYIARTHGFYNMKIPPNNLPKSILNLFKGTVHCSIFLQLTKTEEILAEIRVMFHT